MDKKFQYYALSPDIIETARCLMTAGEEETMMQFVDEAVAITQFSSHAERLLFRDALIKGWVAGTKMEMIG